MYEALGVKDIDLILKKPPRPMPKDPALEHIDALGGVKFQAFPGQDHRAHITAHLNFLATNMVRNAPMVMAAVIEKNCLEHISLMAQEQIELEFREELQQLATSNATNDAKSSSMHNKIRNYNNKLHAQMPTTEN